MKTKISIYKNITDTVGASGDLWAFLATNKWQSLCEQVREEENKDIRTELNPNSKFLGNIFALILLII